MNRGTVDHAPVYPREVMRRAWSCRLVLDPGAQPPLGRPSPSGADVEMTKQVVEAGRSLRITVHEPPGGGRDGVASLKALGLF